MNRYGYISPRGGIDVIEKLRINGHEKLIFGFDAQTGMRAIVAIHNTVLGPATGGIRMCALSEVDAIDEALRLSFAMTYKTAIIDEPFGGAKAVVIRDPRQSKTPEFLHAIGDFIQSLNGSFLTGVDMGFTFDDAKIISERTQYIYNSQGISGVTTAHGVLKGIKECVRYKLHRDSLNNARVAIQGLGHVGGTLADLLLEEGAEIIVSDIDMLKTQKYETMKNARVVLSEDIYDVACDVFAPCAMGGVINDETISRLQCSIIAGGANNQLLDENRHSVMLHDRHILHAPDFVINAGGVCHGMCEVRGFPVSDAMKKIERIPALLNDIFIRSAQENIPPLFVAYVMAHEKIEKARSTESI